DVKETNLKLDKSLVKEIHKKMRRLKRNGELKYSLVTEEHEIEPIMSNFFEFDCERFNSKSNPSRFRLEEEKKYAIQAAKSLLNSNLLHLSYLSLNNEIVGVEFAMADEKKIYLYLTAFNMKFRKFSI